MLIYRFTVVFLRIILFVTLFFQTISSVYANAQNHEKKISPDFDYGKQINLEVVRKKAQSGDAASQYILGKLYEDGYLVIKDIVTAKRWYRKAAENNHAKAQYNLAVILYNGPTVNKEINEIIKLYIKAGKSGVIDGLFNVGSIYLHGFYVDKNYKLAFKWLKQAAEHNHTEAMHNLGSMYLNGLGVSKSKKTAMFWFGKAADNGLLESKFQVMRMELNEAKVTKYSVNSDVVKYAKSMGLNAYKKNDISGVLKYLEPLVHFDDNESLFIVGFTYVSAENGQRNYAKGIKYLTRSASAYDNLDAQILLGEVYAVGIAGPENTNKADYFFKKAAKKLLDIENLSANDAYNLATLYENGWGVKKNLEKANYLYRISEERGEGKPQSGNNSF